MGACCAVRSTGPDNLVVEAAATLDVFQVDSTATRLSNASTLTEFVKLAGAGFRSDGTTYKMKSGETWKINMCVLVCQPDEVYSNSEQVWYIETSTGVFTEFDRYSCFNFITIVGGEKSIPYHRSKSLVASMDNPRMQLKVRRVDSGATAYGWEEPRWGGVEDTEVSP